MNLQQRIDDCLVEMANADDFDERQELLTDFVEMELHDQRERCNDAALTALGNWDFRTALDSALKEACLNAVEKK